MNSLIERNTNKNIADNKINKRNSYYSLAAIEKNQNQL
jgi:hypothetical protein